VRHLFVDLERRVRDDLGGQQRRGRNGNDLIIVTMENEGRDVEPFKSSVRSVSDQALIPENHGGPAGSASLCLSDIAPR